MEGSLRRLQVDHIDLYQVHWPERLNSTFTRPRFRPLVDPIETVPLEETLGFMGELVDEGKARHVGVANETPWGVMRYLEAAVQRDLPRVDSIQNGYSLLSRQFETGLAEIAMREELGLIAYSPLSGGGSSRASGSRRSRATIPASTRQCGHTSTSRSSMG